MRFVTQSYNLICRPSRLVTHTDVFEFLFTLEPLSPYLFTTVKHDQSVQFFRLEHEINVDARVRPQHWHTDKGVLRPKCNWSVQIIRNTFHEFCGDLYRGKTGNGLFCAGSSSQFDIGNVVEVELLNFTDEVWNSGCHADFLLEMVETAEMDGAPLEGVEFALGFRCKI